MRFLRKSDYYRLIQPDELNLILSTASEAGYNPDQLLIDLEGGAIEEVTSYLLARYDVKRIFSDTPIYDPTATYSGQSRVQYHEITYDATLPYTIGQRRSQAGSIYEAIVNITIPEAFTAPHWKFICLDYALFYVTTPYSEFQEFTNYPAGSQVWFKDNYVYTALRQTNGNSLNNAVYSSYGADTSQSPLDVNRGNPGQDVSNVVYWSKSTSPYYISGAIPTDGTKWTAGDNRSQLLIEHLIDIALFKLFATVTPRSIPEIRLIRYNGNDVNQNGGAIGWLKKVAEGEISANLYQNYPQQGLSVIFNSGAPKMTNIY